MVAYIFPYKNASVSAKRIARSLGIRRIRADTQFVSRGVSIINWGSTRLQARDSDIVNKPDAVANSIDKRKALRIMQEAKVRVPAFTESKEEAQQWVVNSPIYARVLPSSSQGRGIIYVDKGGVLPDAPLYTKGIESTAEYRVHVMRGQVIDYTKKIPIINLTITDRHDNIQVRSHQNGWTFARNIMRRPSIEREAIKAVEALGLDFGAVDILINERNRPVVLEVNTACGLEGRTLTAYTQAFNSLINTTK